MTATAIQRLRGNGFGFSAAGGALVLLNSLSMMIQLEMEGRTIASRFGDWAGELQKK